MLEDDHAGQFGALVRMYRDKAGLSQRELAAKAGLSVAALRDFEQGRRRRPRPHSLAALSDALSLTPEQAVDLAQAVAEPCPRADPVPAPRFAPYEGGTPVPAGAPGSHQGLWLSVLGPVEARLGGKSLPVGPPARRAVLGLLSLDPGTLVRRDTIVDALWGEAPPRTAAGLVQAHVSRIRRLLRPDEGGRGGPRLLDSVGGAYRLIVTGHELDLLAFRKLAARAAETRGGGDLVAAAEQYDQAIGLWRGAPLADISVLSTHPGVTALKQELAGVLVEYAEVACAVGEPYRVLPRLQAFADDEPLNELVHAQLMIALAGAGQQAAAIRAYEDMRLRLDQEFGLYPGDELSWAYLRVLRQDIRAGNRPREQARLSPPAAPVPAVPRQLPAAPRGFTGRTAELAALTALLEQGARETGGVVIAALTGMAGIGKTALAVQWAHRVADQFPDGQLFVDVRGCSPSGAPLTPTEAVCGFLTALGVSPAQIPADTAGQAALYRTLLAGRRMLIVLDNAQNAAQIRSLLPASPGCLVLVTSRNRLTGLASAEGAQLIGLTVLTESQSRELLSASLGAEWTAAEPAAVSELISLCGRLPLALCDVAARAAARSGLTLAALAEEMRDARSRLDVLETGEQNTSVRMVFSWSRAQLGDAARRMFRLLGVHPGGDITAAAAASLADVPRQQASLMLTELCDEHLLAESTPGRYTCHVLLRAYTAEWARASDSRADRRAAVRRVLDYYLNTAKAASALLALGQDVPGSPPGVPMALPEEVARPEQAERWLQDEEHTLFALVAYAAEEGYAPHAWELPWILGWHFRGAAHRGRLAEAQEAAQALAARLGNLSGQMFAGQHLGWLSFMRGDLTDAKGHLDAADELASQAGDDALRGLAILSRAYVLRPQDRAGEATDLGKVCSGAAG